MAYYLESCPLFTAIKLIADNASSVQPVLFDKKSLQFVTEHPFLELLNNPNPYTDSDLFMRELFSYFLLTGNAYINATGNPSSKPLEIFNLQPQSVTIQASSIDGFAGQYSYQSNDTSSIFTRDAEKRFIEKNGKQELSQLRAFNPLYNSSNLYGTSSVQACELEIKQYLQASIHNLALLENGARPSGMLTVKGEPLADDQVNKIKEQIKESVSGASNAGKNMFFGSEMAWTQLSESVKDMDFGQLKTSTSVAIYNALKIPLPMVNPDHMSLANMDTAKLSFYDNAVIPLVNTVYAFLESSLLSRYPDGDRYTLTFDESKIEALGPRRVEKINTLSKSGVLTINEIRDHLGYEEIEGGDTIYQPMNLVPVGQDNFTQDNRKVPAQKNVDWEKEIFVKLMQDYTDEKGNRLYSDEQIASMAVTHH
jgi:HK97 family phage portal protein